MILHPRDTLCRIVPPAIDVFAPGAPHPLPNNQTSLSTFTREPNGTCISGETVMAPLLDRGPLLDLMTLPPLSIQELGRGRLRARFGVGPTGHAARNPSPSAAIANLPAFIFIDSARAAPCSPQPVSDATTRCLPVSLARADLTYFTDAACTMPAALITPSYGCQPPFPLIATPSDTTTPAGSSPPPIDGLYAQGDASAADIYLISGKGAGCIKEDGLKTQGFLLAPLTALDLKSFGVVMEAME